jgi:hypothetical protein
MHAGFLLQSATLEAVLERARDLISSAAQGGLELLLAVLVVLVGWLIAQLLSRLVLWVLRAARFNAGVRRLMVVGSGALRYEPAALASWFVYWTVIALAVMLAADAMGLNLSSSVGDRLREVLPRVIAATIELVAGIALAMGLGAVTQRIFEGAGLRRSRLRGQVVTVVLSAFAVLLALEQLGLAAQFILGIGITAIAAAGLGAALAFGLGCRDLARDFVVEYLRSLDDDTREHQG